MTTLAAALRLADREVVAFVGAGGKTTALFACARELRAGGSGVAVTTTTKIFVPPPSPDLMLVVGADRAAMIARARDAIAEGRIPVIASATADGKLAGITRDDVRELARDAVATHVLVEADGSARLPITAPREDEPVIPGVATVVVVVVGVDALEGEIGTVAHRPERVTALTGLRDDEHLDADAVARVMLGPGGNTKGAPAAARIVALVNKADDARRLARARDLATAIRRNSGARVVVAALESAGVREVLG